MGVLSTLRLRSGLGCDPRPIGGPACTSSSLRSVSSPASSSRLLAVVAVRRWRRRRDQRGRLARALVPGAGPDRHRRAAACPAHPHGFVLGALLRFEIELLVLFPYLVYRFATGFVPPSRRLQRVVGPLTIGLSIWTFALPTIPAAGDPRPTRLPRLRRRVPRALDAALGRRHASGSGGRAAASHRVAASRMRMLSFASAALTVAIIGSAFATDQDSVAALVVQLLALAERRRLPARARAAADRPRVLARAGAAAAAGGDPRPDDARDDSHRGRAARARPGRRRSSARGRRASIDADGHLARAAAVAGRGRRASSRCASRSPASSLNVWTSPYAPFFGEDELRTLHTVAALTGIALDRVRLFEQEHQARLALERANEVMTNFVALAAHELRTPVTTVHGFVQTLNHLGDRLDESQQDELRLALEQQTARMAALVEQLLDLSRLDAEAVEVKPQELDLRQRLEDVVAVAAGSRRDDVASRSIGPTVGRRRSRRSSTTSSPTSSRTRSATGRRRCSSARWSTAARCASSVEDAGPGRRARDRGDAVRAVHPRRRRPRPRRGHRARPRDRARLRTRAQRRPSLRARPAGRRALRGRAARAELVPLI